MEGNGIRERCTEKMRGPCKVDKNANDRLVGRWMERLMGGENIRVEADEASRVAKNVTGNEEVGSVEERKERIRQFGETRLQGVSGVNQSEHLYLPRSLRKLSRIFRVLETIERFNADRGLTTIFIKSQRCIEKLVKQNVGLDDVERMYFVAPELFKFKKISVHHEGKEVDTFVIYLSGGSGRFDECLIEYAKRMHARFIESRGYLWSGSRYHPEYDIEERDVERMKIFEDDMESPIGKEAVSNREMEYVPVKQSSEIKEKGKSRALTILERIKEKERLRREEFMSKSKEEEDNRMISKRILLLFKSESKRAIAADKVIGMLNIFDGMNVIKRIMKWDGTLFYMKTMNGRIYIVLYESKE
ncbi:hypothetical protein HK407_07g11830 [Ordospora pajunii]|uniref:uncharacterized protein n=1 Tax=Ordospora pajunii TaxID=3039483 RepID=UPI00295264D0|nr:uncharacterized protein HK407_07g11830 [Ordospora pajunii]KAH9411191.1 hypothetical protein HK407_07g11830 [Ordospora pajunii]